MHIQGITRETARAAVQERTPLVFDPRDVFLGLFDGNTLVSFLGLYITDRRIKLRANYTIPGRRREGNFSTLMHYVVENYPRHELYAGCLESSVGVYLAHGFTVQREKQFTHLKVIYVIKEPTCQD